MGSDTESIGSQEELTGDERDYDYSFGDDDLSDNEMDGLAEFDKYMKEHFGHGSVYFSKAKALKSKGKSSSSSVSKSDSPVKVKKVKVKAKTKPKSKISSPKTDKPRKVKKLVKKSTSSKSKHL
jgi:hypothetical protein